MVTGRGNSSEILTGLRDNKAGSEETVVVTTSAKGKEGRCPYCGSTRLYRHGSCRPRKVLHTWSHGKRVYLEFNRCRLKCRDCQRTFADGMELVHSRSRLTRQAETEALWQLKNRKLSQVTKDLGLGYGTLQRLLEREINRESLSLIPDEYGVYLGVDGYKFKCKKPVRAVSRVKKRKTLGILGDKRIATLKRFLSRIRER